MSERDELAAPIKDVYYAARDNGGTMHTAADDAADSMLASDWLRRDRARVAAGTLIGVADGTRFPSHWILFRRADGSGVTVGDFLRETAARIRRDAGIGGGGDG